MNKRIFFSLLMLSFFACKKENNNTVSNAQEIDSIVYYNKWTKMNKVPLRLTDYVTDISYLPNKAIALLTNSRVYFIDSNYKVNLSPRFFSNSGIFYMKFQTYNDFPNIKDRFFYLTDAISSSGKSNQLIIENTIYGSEVNTQIYSRNFFVKDTNQNNSYNYMGYGEDYYAYYIYKALPNLDNYQLRYFNNQKRIDTTISFTGEGYNTTFRLGDKVVFWKYYNNVFTTINIRTMSVQENQSVPKNFSFIGTFNNSAYFYNNKFFNQGIYKSNNFTDFEMVYKNDLINNPVPYFNEKYLLIVKYLSTYNDQETEFILLNLENKSSQILSMPLERYEKVRCNWIIDNVLYVLTEDNIYARKF